MTWQIADKEGLNSRAPTKDNCFGSVQTIRKTRPVWRSMDTPLLLKRASQDSIGLGGTCSKNSTVNDPSSIEQMIAMCEVHEKSRFSETWPSRSAMA